MSKCLHQAKAETIYLTKKEGGLGITDLARWNQAAYMGLTFKGASQVESIWASWVIMYHLRGKFFWTTNIPKDCSWVWRHVLKSREYAMKFTIYSIADGKGTLLWHDPWCHLSPLINSPAAKEAWQNLFGLEAKVEVLLDNRAWNEVVL
ncbi:hypothetical protein FRX31_002279 [Thalictrum thalictroides]|uniref:Uncharacterized protein n=1 Tax=Thalictrum thalictroides TaxID=46969 RepID=A0A7J6XEA6_THATH|nr:hypothetical protein FRX31_002279 [Thalictrum thalictroides]